MNHTSDKSELDKLRKQLAQYEAWFRAIDENSNFDFWFKNASSSYTYVNPHFAESMGRDICHLQDAKPEDIFDAERLGRVKALDQQVMNEGYLTRVIPCNASGRMQMHEEHRFAVKDEVGEAIGLGCFAFEVTEKSLAEETLHQAEKIANLCSWRWSSETNLLISCSDQMAEFLGVSVTETFGVFPDRAQTLVLPQDRHVFKEIEDRIKGVANGAYRIEYRIRRADGRVIHVRETAEPFLTSSGAGEYLGVMQDITREKQAELALLKLNESLESKIEKRTAQLQTAKNAAETANKAKSEFLATMSHELLTPMNGVLGMAEVLSLSELDVKQKEILSIIQQSGDGLVTILNDILEFSNLDTDLIVLEIKPFNLRDVVSDVVSFLTPMANRKGLEFRTHVESNVPETLMGDTLRLKQLLIKLTENAIKFTPKGCVGIAVNTVVEGPTANVSIKIIDTGIGIPSDKTEMIFDEFTQVDQSNTREHGGTGLGLSIAKNIVQAMPEGKISVRSEVDQGSVFTVEFSLDLAAQAPSDEASSLDFYDERLAKAVG